MRRWGKKRPSGMRSGYEDKIAANLEKDGIAYQYEPNTFSILVRETGRWCALCFGTDDIYRRAKYTPDFKIGGEDLDIAFVEAKGRLTAKERKIILAFRDQVAAKEGYGYAVLIQRDNKLSKVSKTRYSDWLRKNNIPFAVGERIPPAWAKGDFRP